MIGKCVNCGEKLSIAMIMDDGTTNDLLLVEAMEIVEMVKLIHYWHFSIIHLVHMWSIYNFDYFLLLHVFLGGGGSKVDQIVAYKPKGLLIPHVSMPANVIPPWNIHKHDHMGIYFQFLMLTLTMVVARSCSYERSRMSGWV